MAFTIQESFQVPASPAAVWEYLVDPERVVQCLPGAELLEVMDQRNFRGRIKVSVGPVTVTYEGTAEFVEIDEQGRRVQVEAQGQEASGPGSARMTMVSRVTADSDGGAEVRVEATVDVAGKIVQFGRGMIQTVSSQLFREFSGCARSRLSVDGKRQEEGALPDSADAPRSTGSGDGGSIRPLRLLFSALLKKLRALFRP